MVLRSGVGGRGDDVVALGDGTRRLHLADPLRRLQAVHHRHLNIHQDDVVQPAALHNLDSLRAVVGDIRRHPAVLHDNLRHLLVHQVVLDDENVAAVAEHELVRGRHERRDRSPRLLRRGGPSRRSRRSNRRRRVRVRVRVTPGLDPAPLGKARYERVDTPRGYPVVPGAEADGGAPSESGVHGRFARGFVGSVIPRVRRRQALGRGPGDATRGDERVPPRVIGGLVPRRRVPAARLSGLGRRGDGGGDVEGRDGARRLSEVRRRSRLLLVEHHLGGFERLAE